MVTKYHFSSTSFERLGQKSLWKFRCCFLVDLEMPKSPFEINWPLVENKSNQIFGFPHSEFDLIMTKSADDTYDKDIRKTSFYFLIF